MQLPYSETLEIQYLSRLFDNTSECYKFFWFQAIISKALEGKDCLSYEELINEMIADAWYMVTEYHLNLGPRDTLEALVHDLQEKFQLKSSERKENILNYLENCRDREVERRKRTLTKNVPYRLQAPFMEKLKGKAWNVSEKTLVSQLIILYHGLTWHTMNFGISIRPQRASTAAKITICRIGRLTSHNLLN